MLLKCSRVTLSQKARLSGALQNAVCSLEGGTWDSPVHTRTVRDDSQSRLSSRVRCSPHNSHTSTPEASAGTSVGGDGRGLNLPFAAKCWWLALGSSHPLKEKEKNGNCASHGLRLRERGGIRMCTKPSQESLSSIVPRVKLFSEF